ncbi:tetratricopeptide repeat-containing sensor histidine kinase [Kordia jejudonensis]|uniref:tetratricopeptide repeat-containing sensor histidine kinase n=1 Tax=Kordia jejudonensis TaxID=1348245 RepID=UPI0006295987|nr:tetratricopeptide repeat protein [Kordia jejudonensis]
MSNIKLFLIVISFHITNVFYAQKNGLAKQQIDYYQKGKEFHKEKKYDSAISYFEKYKSEALLNNDTIKAANAFYRIGLCYLTKENYKKAEDYFKETLSLEVQMKDSLRIAKGYNNVGIAKYYLSQLDSCLFYYDKALSIYRITSKKKLPQFLKNIGLVHKKKGDYLNASNYLFEAAQLLENEHKKAESASTYNIIGMMFNESGYDSLSLNYHSLSLKIRKELQDTLAIAKSLNNIANVAKRVYGLDSSLTTYNRAFKLIERFENDRIKSKILNNIGEVHLELKDYKKSKSYFKKSLVLKEELGDQYGIAYSLLNITKILLHEKKIREAEKLINRGLKISEEINSLTLLVQYHGIYSQLLTTNKEFEKATKYYKSYLQLKDSLLNELKIKSLSNAEVKYRTADLEKQVAFLEPLEGEIKILSLENENQKDKIKFQTTINWFLFFIVLAILFVLILLWRLGKQRKQINELLELKNEEITHRIKNNLEILTGIFNNQLRVTNNESVKEILTQNKHRLKVINHLHNRLSSEPNKDISAKIYFEGLIDDLLFSFNFSKSKCDSSIDELQISTDTILHVGLLMNELITNAIKHGLKETKEPKLEISLKNYDSYLELKVKDNGHGLPENIDLVSIESYGMILIDKIVNRQLDGELIYAYKNGALFTINIPI